MGSVVKCWGMDCRGNIALPLGNGSLLTPPVPVKGSHGEHKLLCVLGRRTGQDGHRPSWVLCVLKPISDVAKMLK